MATGSTVAVSPGRLARLTAIAVRAGHAAMAHYHDGVAVRQKGDKGPVTAGRPCRPRVIVARARRPGTRPSRSFRKRATYRIRHSAGHGAASGWSDPLDGTKEFIQRNGEFTVNIALIEDGDAGARRDLRSGARVCCITRGDRDWERGSAARRRRADADLLRPPLAGSRLRAWRRAARILRRNWSSTSRPSRWRDRVPGGKLAQVLLGRGRKARHLSRGWGPTMEWDVAAG